MGISTKPIYRMSGAGHCATAICDEYINTKNEESKPDYLMESAEEGKWHEDRIVEELQQGKIDIPGLGKVKVNVFARQQEQVIDTNKFTLLGHIDGRGTPEVDRPFEHGIEIKSMSQNEFDRWFRGQFSEFPHYADQLTCYMEETKLPFLYIVKNRNYGRKWLGWYKEPPSKISNIIDKFNLITDSVSENKICEWKKFDFNDIECRRCHRSSKCIQELPKLPESNSDEIIQAVKTWKINKTIKNDAEQEIDKAERTLENYLTLTGMKKTRFTNTDTNVDVSLTASDYTRTFYDYNALIAKFGSQQLEFAKKVSNVHRFTIFDFKSGVVELGNGS